MIAYKNYSLKKLNTFGMDSQCAIFIAMEDPTDVFKLDKAHVFEHPHYILGSGSNTLFTKRFEGTVIHPVFKGIEIKEETDDDVLLRVAAGETWSDFIDYCIQNQYYGLENLIGIPGLVGSAPVQNIGAYGVEVKDCIDRVEGYYTNTTQEFILAAAQCQFGYRNSLFKNGLKGKALITYVWFRLSKKEHYNLSYKALADEMEHQELSLKSVTDCILKIRNSKLPNLDEIGCAGSFFKNPIILRSRLAELLENFPDLTSYHVDDEYVKLAAGQLIEKAGWKGKRVGNAGVYDKQALVVVNYGNATAEEITNVYQSVIQDVYAMFDILLSPEVNIL